MNLILVDNDFRLKSYTYDEKNKFVNGYFLFGTYFLWFRENCRQRKDFFGEFVELNYLSGPRIASSGFDPNDAPNITFDLKENKVSGKSSCNSYSGTLNVDANETSFKGPMAVTKMFCPGEGENVYIIVFWRNKKTALFSGTRRLKKLKTNLY